MLPACCPTRATVPKVAIVVADHDMLRRYFVDVLAIAGYETLPTADGAVALKLLESRPDIGFLVMNFQTSRVDGFTLARQAREQCPDVGIVHISSSAPGEVARSAVPGSCHLSEPCGPSALLDCMAMMAADSDGAPARFPAVAGDAAVCVLRSASLAR